MGVDNKYHVASLVAVFFALALGVLIGVALTGHDDEGLRTEWVAAIDREMHLLRAQNKEMASLLDEAKNERDVLQRLAHTLTLSLTGPKINGRTVGLLIIAPDDQKARRYESMEKLLAASGSTIVSHADLLTAALNGESFADPPFVVLVLEDSFDRYHRSVNAVIERLRQSDVTRFVAVSGEGDRWKRFLSEKGIPFVSHPETILGRLGLLLLLADDAPNPIDSDDEHWSKIVFGGDDR